MDREDVITLARYAGEQHLPLIPRGAGTQVAGGAIGAGIVVDFSRHMRRIQEISADTVRVEPGIVRDELNAALRGHGRYFPPDPSTSAVTTVGGMLGVDAAGSHAVRVGSTRDHVRSLELVLADGTLVTAGEERWDLPGSGLRLAGTSGGESTNGGDSKREILSRLKKLLQDHRELIDERQPPGVRNCSGYFLRGVLAADRLHLHRLLVGSEGTLGLFTGATLHTAPLPAYRGVALLLFGDLESAIEAVQVLAEQQPSACDLLDRRLLSLGREADERFERWIPKTAEAGLLVEQTGYSERQVRDRLRSSVAAVVEREATVVVARETADADEVEFLWSLPTRVVPLLTRILGDARPLPFVEDVAVPPAALADFLLRAQRVFQRHEVTSTLYAHAASGQVHLRPFLPQPEPANAGRIEDLSRDLYEIVFSVGGSISGEHGDGLSRTAFIRSQYGPLYHVFREVKDIFDPHNLLNPGKIINDDPDLTTRRLRLSVTPPQLTELQLAWTPEEMSTAAERCTTCGICRSRAEGRMCPLFHVEPQEHASPRAKAQLMRDLAAGRLDRQVAASDEFKEVADLCFNCKQCQLECPSQVNVPHLMIEAKASYVALNGISQADWLLSRAHSFGIWGCRMAPLSNWVLGNRFVRYMLEKTLGISRHRRLPTFARRPFVHRHGTPTPAAERRVAGNGDRPIVYFVDHFANFHDPELGQAFLKVMAHHGVEVIVPVEQTASGMAMISAGDLEAAREVAAQNLRVLGEFAREGFDIVCTEPAAALCLRTEYPMLLRHPDVELVASRVREAGELLRAWHQEGRLKTDFAPLQVEAAYHTPCHLRALGPHAPLADIVSLIPGLTLRRIEEGCSGMAGAFGLTHRNFKMSVRIGARLMTRMSDAALNLGVTECSSCRLQMQQGTSIPTVHPLKLLACAYSGSPELRRLLAPATRRLTV